MTGSAFFGDPPNNQNDWFVIRGYGRLLHIPDDMYDPSKGLPIPFQRPQGIHYKSRGPGMIAGAAVAIAMVLLLTGTRLWLRFFRRDLRVGWEYVLRQFLICSRSKRRQRRAPCSFAS